MSETYDKLNHWYGWNGGECPVHPGTIVTLACPTIGVFVQGAFAKDVNWESANAFCIDKLYVEPKKPREWRINVYSDGATVWFGSPEDANDEAYTGWVGETVLVREVLPEDEA